MPRILHLGLGNFHRAHQAAYLDELNRLGESRDARGDVSDPWWLAGGNIAHDTPEVISALVSQEGRYTLETVSPGQERRWRQIGSIREVVPLTSGLAGLIELAAQDSTRIISFTVTEAGYHLDLDHHLDLTHADVAADLGDPASHRTIYGALALLLKARQRAGAGPVTLQTCDNLRSNGDRFAAGFWAFLAARGDAELMDWVRAHTSTPNSMVDRITPRTPDDLRSRVAEETGWDDAAPVMSETFIQWVIEDNFIAGRPEWEQVGVELVDDVEPFEEAKIRLLNASHSALAWPGVLAGHRYVHEAATDPRLVPLVRGYTDEAIACLTPSPVDLPRYRDATLERFANPAIADTLARITQDSFAKLPGMVLPTIVDRLIAGESIAASAVLPAAMFAFLERWHLGQLDFDYRDELMDPAHVHGYFAAPDPLAAFLAESTLFGDLAGDARLRAGVEAGLARLAGL